MIEYSMVVHICPDWLYYLLRIQITTDWNAVVSAAKHKTVQKETM